MEIVWPYGNEKLWGVYKITNKINGKSYIGQSRCKKGMRFRWQLHINELQSRRHINEKLQNAWNKHGSESFRFEVLELISPSVPNLVEFMDARETHFISQFDSFKRGYNKTTGGNSGGICSEYTKAKISDAAKCRDPQTRKHSAETKKKISESSKGKHVGKTLSEQARAKLSAKLQGQKRSPEHRARVGAANRGKILSHETKTKIAMSLTGKQASESAKQKMSKTRTGMALSVDAVAKLVAFHTGRKRSPETCKRISEAKRKKFLFWGS